MARVRCRACHRIASDQYTCVMCGCDNSRQPVLAKPVGDTWRGHAASILTTAIPIGIFATIWETIDEGWRFGVLQGLVFLVVFGACWAGLRWSWDRYERING